MSDIKTVGPIELLHISPSPLWGRLSLSPHRRNSGTLIALWSYDEHTGRCIDHHLDINITRDHWFEAQDRFRLISSPRTLV